MSYINQLYYDSEYKGVPVEDSSLLDRLMSQASDDIDIITHYRIGVLDEQPAFVQEQVKKAVAAQTEHLYLKEESSLNVTIGKFKYSESASQVTDKKVSDRAIACLTPTGLLYTGMGVK